MQKYNLTNDPNRYIKEENYSEGFVCCIDILGFGKFVTESSYKIIRDFYNEVINLSGNIMRNLENRICILSDTIFITLDKKDFKHIDSQLSSLSTFCRLFRQISLDRLGLEIRAGITYGKYLQSGASDFIIFGPAVVRAHQLAEKLDEIKEIPSDIKQYRPAAIVIDNNVYEVEPGNIVFNYYLKENVILKSGYILINPFDDFPYNKYNKKELATKYLDFFVTKGENDHLEKYKISKNFASFILSDYDENKKIEFFGKDICTTSMDLIAFYKGF